MDAFNSISLEVGPMDLYVLINNRVVPYAPEMAPILGTAWLMRLLVQGRIPYHASMDAEMGGNILKSMIANRFLAYDPRMDAVLGGEYLYQLLVEGHVKYAESMAIALGTQRLSKLGHQGIIVLDPRGEDMPEVPPMPTIIAASLTGSYPDLPEDGDPDLKDGMGKQCVLCSGRECRTQMEPCKHSYACISCMHKFRPRSCDKCGMPVTSVVRL